MLEECHLQKTAKDYSKKNDAVQKTMGMSCRRAYAGDRSVATLNQQEMAFLLLTADDTANDAYAPPDRVGRRCIREDRLLGTLL